MSGRSMLDGGVLQFDCAGMFPLLEVSVFVSVDLRGFDFPPVWVGVSFVTCVTAQVSAP